MKKVLLNIKKAGGSVYRPVEKVLKNAALRKRTRYAYYHKYLPIQPNVILYESFFGRGMLCNPYALFLQLLSDSQYRHFTHIWALDNLDNHSILIDSYRNNKNVHFIQYQGKDYLKYLCSAKYLINNVTFPSFFTKKPGQIYINTWHGIPLKALGFDMPNGSTEVSNTLRNFMHTDYLISASPFLTDIYKSAFKMEGIFPGTVIEEGYPRLDILFRFTYEQIITKLEQYGVKVEPGKKIILFAPTWRGVSYQQADTDVDFYFNFKEKLEQEIDLTKYQILIKVHQRVYELAKSRLNVDYIIPATVDANEVLSVTDILISDFSSIYFDYLATGKPILFFINDIENYKKERGLYMSCDELPGPNTNSFTELGVWINNIESVRKEYNLAYSKMQKWANSICTGMVSETIIRVIFDHEEKDKKIYHLTNSKRKILISRGEMRVNGISTSLLNLLNNFDYNTYDVSLMISTAKDNSEKELIRRINPNVRIFYRNSTFNMTVGEQIKDMFFSRFGYSKSVYPMYEREWKRSYGEARFDYVIDFEGYNTFYARLLLQADSAVKCIWQHNDMAAEQMTRFPWLENVFKMYRYFDKIVSCSYDIMQVNAKNLSNLYCDENQFRYAKNCTDKQKIYNMLDETATVTYNQKTYIVEKKNIENGCENVKLIPCFPENDINGNKIFRFVTIGRLSIEKNQENLILGFKRLYQENPNIYLYIIGDGPLKKKLNHLIQSLKLSEHIILTGNIKNPFSVMRFCDCFILPSLHEGQPMVVNEARIMNMPIILSEFSSVKGTLIDNGQLLIGMTEDEIYKGLQAFIHSEVPYPYSFDADEYNHTAFLEFLNAVQS